MCDRNYVEDSMVIVEKDLLVINLLFLAYRASVSHTANNLTGVALQFATQDQKNATPAQ